MTDMDIAAMPIVQNLPIPDLTPFRRATQATACAPQVNLCGELLMADTQSTTTLYEFLTRMAQGFTAYSDIATEAVRVYAAGQKESVERIRNSCTRTAPGLPAITPTLTDPAEEE